MSRALTPPSAGQPIRASFFAELLREVRANRLVNGPGYRTKRTPNGTALDIERARTAQSGRLPGCFELVKGENGGRVFQNPYFMVGSRLYRCHDEDVTAGATTAGIYYLRIELDGEQPQGKLGFVQDYATLQSLAETTADAIHPLYELGEGGAAKVDLRNIPSISAREFGA